MKKYLLPKTGFFYKANMHCHTTLSDGKLTPQEIKEHYKNKGYSVVAFTDHDIFIPHPELKDDNFLPLNGFEVEINQENTENIHAAKTCHICFVALNENITEQPMWNPEYLFGNAPKNAKLVKYNANEPFFKRPYGSQTISKMMHIGKQKGFFFFFNHQVWSLENYGDYINYTGMDAVEILNYSCARIGLTDSVTVYDDLLRAGNKIYALATDDCHTEPDIGGGFIVIKAEALTYSAVASALKNGNFYASSGPEIKELYFENNTLYYKCSEALSVTFTTDVRWADAHTAKTDLVTEGHFEVPDCCNYFRLTVTDSHGKQAHSNAYFTKDL